MAPTEYVYAVSNEGTWNNGNWMTLGRVSRGLIERLDAADWEFVHGFDDKGEPIWRPRHENALYVFRSPGRASMTGIHYIAPLDLYLMPQWHYPHPDDPKRRWNVHQVGVLFRAGPLGTLDTVSLPGLRAPGFLQSQHPEQIHQ